MRLGRKTSELNFNRNFCCVKYSYDAARHEVKEIAEFFRVFKLPTADSAYRTASATFSATRSARAIMVR